MSLNTKPLSPAIGVEVSGLDMSVPLDDETRKEILAQFYEHVALLFRGQSLTVEQQNRFTTTFGEIGKRTVGPRLRKSEDDIYTTPVMVVSNILENGKPLEGASANGDAEMGFHQDTAFHEIPDAVTILYGIEVSAHGGHTKLANMYQACDNVPRDLKTRLEGCQVLQIYDYQRHRIDANVDLNATRYYLQPIFITHPVTGRKALYVNRMMSARIEGMDPAESEAILNTLFDIAEDESLIYEHTWEVGDLLMWDNLCSIHARTFYPDNERRLLRRTTVAGTDRLHA
jgi:taurine dioxygenase